MNVMLRPQIESTIEQTKGAGWMSYRDSERAQDFARRVFATEEESMDETGVQHSRPSDLGILARMADIFTRNRNT